MTTYTLYQNFIGIDIAKSDFVISINESNRTESYANNRVGISKFYNANKAVLEDGLVILETTGGYENLLIEFLVKKGCKVHRAHAQKVKHFVKSLGLRAKSDSIDATALSRYGRERHMGFRLESEKDEDMESLKFLITRRDDLVRMRTQEKNRLKSPNKASMRRSIQRMLSGITKELEIIDGEIKALTKEINGLSEKLEVLKTIDGIGDHNAINLVVQIADLGKMDRRKLASFVGVAPHPKDSGEYRGYRSTSGGKESVRSKLILGALSASRSKGLLGAYYSSLISKGKKPIVAIVALARKILVIANARMRDYLETGAVA